MSRRPSTDSPASGPLVSKSNPSKTAECRGPLSLACDFLSPIDRLLMGRTVRRLARRPRSSSSRSRQPIRTSPRRVLRHPPWRSCVFTSVRPPLATFIQFHGTKLKTKQNMDPQPALPHLVAVETALTFNVSYCASLVLDTAIADDAGEGGGGCRMETLCKM